MRVALILLISFVLVATTVAPEKEPVRLTRGQRVCGLSFVAPPRPFTGNPMEAVSAVSANWITVIPYAFTRTGTPSVRYGQNQWWGERPEGIRATLEMAREASIRVMLKPQVYIPGSWVGNLEFDTPEKWAAWEADYRRYILEMAALAEEYDVQLFCIGTEFREHTRDREAFWRQLIDECREVYSGELTYSANWDDYRGIPFWDALDYIGLSAYFPLSESATPNQSQLVRAWQPVKKELRQFAYRHEKPILFTEFGYLSVDGCAGKTWELEGRVRSLDVNEPAQAIALEALFQVFWEEAWWQGGFLWKWFPEMKGHEGYVERDYTPQGKIAEKTVRFWYGQSE